MQNCFQRRIPKNDIHFVVPFKAHYDRIFVALNQYGYIKTQNLTPISNPMSSFKNIPRKTVSKSEAMIYFFIVLYCVRKFSISDLFRSLFCNFSNGQGISIDIHIKIFVHFVNFEDDLARKGWKKEKNAFLY
jgi:hypothetical protein